MKDLPKISDAEWQVMKIIWNQSPLTANDIAEKLANEIDWSPRTIKTLLNRLMNKKALGVQQEGRIYYYYPLVSREECARLERDSLLKKVYNGALKPMLAAFLEEQDLSPREIEELRQILDRKGKSK